MVMRVLKGGGRFWIFCDEVIELVLGGIGVEFKGGLGLSIKIHEVNGHGQVDYEA